MGEAARHLAVVPELDEAPAPKRSRRCSCGELIVAERQRGRLPAKCNSCDPNAAERRRQAAARSERKDRRTQKLMAEVMQLKAALEYEPKLVDPELVSKEGLARAVRRVATAQGRLATAAALREVADVALAWAVKLEVSPGSDRGGSPSHREWPPKATALELH